MSRVFSFRDLRLIPALTRYTEAQLLHPYMDETVNPVLAQLGFDLDYAILYVPALHRDLQGKVGIGFRAVGEIGSNASYLRSGLCSTIERLIAASHKDMSLTKELAKLMGHSISIQNTEYDPVHFEYPVEETEPDSDRIAARILELENLRDKIRGNPYNERGALKTPREHEILLG